MVEEDWAARRALSCGIFCQGRLIGYVGVLEINASRGRGELAFWIDESYVGQGVAYWATRAAAAVAFSRLNLRVLIINCHAQNLRARRLAQRLGAVAYRTAQTKVAYRLTARNLHDTNKG